MDDGKCLLDVISDPQALKEFFRSTSQIAFVEGKVPPLSDETNNKPEPSQHISRSDDTALSTCNSQLSNSQSSNSSTTLTGHMIQQSTPLAHFSFPASSGNGQGNFLANNLSSVTNGLSNNARTNDLSAVGSTGSSGISVNSPHLLTSKPNIQNTSILSSAGAKQVGVTTLQTTLTNSPLSFAFNDSGKTRSILSTSSVSLAMADKPITVSSKQTINQQATKSTPPRRPQNVKALPLPILRPKGIAPRPQNAVTPADGNLLTQGIKTVPIKGQPQLVAIRPKLIIAQSNPSGSGQNTQASLGTLNTRPKQNLQNAFTLGAKGQTQMPKQILNTVTVPQLQQGVSNQIGKSGLAGLVQLQPKQIAPKPEQVSTAQSGKGKQTQDQTYLQLVQNLLAHPQFGAQTNVGQKDLKQASGLGQENLTQQQKLAQQNQLKKLLQQNQLVQQALQVRVQQQQQQQQLSQQQQQLSQQQLPQQQISQQQQQLSQPQQVSQQQQLTLSHSQQQQQQALLQMKSPQTNSSPVTATQQAQLQVPSATINAANLASQLKEAINTKQLQQFLEKNPVVAQQLRQLNLRQAALLSNTRQQNVTPGNTISTTVATPVKTIVQLQKPTALMVGELQKTTGNQLQTVGILQKPVINQLQKPAQSVPHLPKTTLNQLQKPSTNLTLPQNPVVSSMTKLQKAGATNIVTQLPKSTASLTHVTIANPKKVITIPSTGQNTSMQKTDQKPATTQKVVIVQNSNALGMAAANDGQPKVLLQTKEGRPILLSQEQFKQIQAQLASKNLSIQGKLVTASPVTTKTAAMKPQVVVKSEPGAIKVNQKVLATTPKSQIKQDVTKTAKRPIKVVETEESKLIKRVKLTVQKDQNDVCSTDIHKPFKSQQDAITRLTPYHVYSEPIPNAKMQHKANVLLDKLALQLTYKSDKMIDKYRQLLLNDMQRDVPSAEVVMVNRIYLADEKAALLQKKQTMLEEAKQMAQAARATLNQTNTSESNLSPAGDPMTNQLSTVSMQDLHPDTSEPIEISDDDSSPITSANSFLTQVSDTRTDMNAINRTLEPG